MPGGYADPLDLIWVYAARRLGLTVVRTSQTYASTDGRGQLQIGASQTLDPDDCLAQMILHELCHWMINGADAVHYVDWGFEPMEAVDWREYPTLRLQRWLCDSYGLADVLAPTTDARAYWDRLVDPLVPLDDSELETQILGATLLGVKRSCHRPWGEAVQGALVASAAVVEACREGSGRLPQVPIDDALWSFAGS